MRHNQINIRISKKLFRIMQNKKEFCAEFAETLELLEKREKSETNILCVAFTHIAHQLQEENSKLKKIIKTMKGSK